MNHWLWMNCYLHGRKSKGSARRAALPPLGWAKQSKSINIWPKNEVISGVHLLMQSSDLQNRPTTTHAYGPICKEHISILFNLCLLNKNKNQGGPHIRADPGSGENFLPYLPASFSSAQSPGQRGFQLFHSAESARSDEGAPLGPLSSRFSLYSSLG